MMSKRVLYVEDHPNNRLLVQRIVQAEGLEFLAAADAEAGWHTAVTHHPDLIFMDLHLPGGLTGFDLTRQLRQHPVFAHTPIVALTAFGNDEAEQAALEAGCNGFLRKPADIRQIRAILRQYLGEPTPATQPGTAVTVIYL
ncbi:MAG TPA: response regulator [Chloroflexota bacterium]|nr:response regulator [Chloroflexota bacterium]HUM71352.1 response regulator [Chloroflexota bacterium]